MKELTVLFSAFVDYFELNPFQVKIQFLYPLQSSENLWFSDVFRGYRNRTLFHFYTPEIIRKPLFF